MYAAEGVLGDVAGIEIVSNPMAGWPNNDAVDSSVGEDSRGSHLSLYGWNGKGIRSPIGDLSKSYAERHRHFALQTSGSAYFPKQRLPPRQIPR